MLDTGGTSDPYIKVCTFTNSVLHYKCTELSALDLEAIQTRASRSVPSHTLCNVLPVHRSATLDGRSLKNVHLGLYLTHTLYCTTSAQICDTRWEVPQKRTSRSVPHTHSVLYYKCTDLRHSIWEVPQKRTSRSVPHTHSVMYYQCTDLRALDMGGPSKTYI